MARRGLWVAGLLGTTTFLGACQRPAAPGSPELPAAMAQALGESRRFSAAFSGGFTPAPCDPDPEPGRPIERPRCALPPRWGTEAWAGLQRLAPRLRAEAAGVDPEALRARAIWDLIWSDTLDAAEQAVARLEEAVARSPTRPDLLSDLAAAYLVRAERSQDARDLVAALDAAERAWGLADQPPSLCPNLLLARRRLHLVLGATEAEARCPQAVAVGREPRVPSPAPSDPEAEPSLERLRRDLVHAPEAQLVALGERHPGAGREAGISELVGGWAEALSRGDEQAASGILQRCRTLAATIARRHGDLVLETVAAQISSAGEAAVQHLAVGALALRNGRQALDRLDVEAAASAYGEATARFHEAGGGVLLALAQLGQAATHRYLGRDDDALALLHEVVSTTRELPALAARATLQIGDLEKRRGDLVAAEHRFRRALRQLEQLGEVETAGAVAGLLDELLDLLGEPDRAWEARLRALALLADRPSSDWRLMALVGASRAAQASSHHHAAFAFQSESLAASSESTLRYPALLNRARTSAALGRGAAAREALSSAAAEIGGIASQAMRRRAEGELHLAEASVRDVLGEPLAERNFELAEAEFDALRLPEHEAELWRLRGRARLRGGDAAGARVDLERAYRRLRASILGRLGEGAPTEVWATQRRVLEDLALLELDALGHPDRALGWLEEGTVATAADVPRARRESPDLLASVQRLLPPHAALVRYGVVGDRLLIWVATPTRWELVQSAWPVRERSEELRRFRGAARRPGDVLGRESAGAALGRRLLDPVRTLAPQARELWIVTDPAVESVPFAALPFGGSGRPAIEELLLVFHGSLSDLVATRSARSEPAPPASWRALVVGEPALSPDWAGSLPALPGAAAEASAVAARFPRGRLLVGVEATRPALLGGLVESDLLHFAGHALPAGRDGQSAQLLLAPSEPNGGGEALGAIDLVARGGPAPRLVVLAACASAGSPSGERRRTIGLLQAFARLRVPAVLGALWEIDDAESQALVLAFYDQLLAGRSAAEALRAAQLERLHATPSHAAPAWAAFRLLGDLPAQSPLN